MSGPDINRPPKYPQHQGWLRKVQLIHSRVDNACRSLKRFTPADFLGKFGHVDPKEFGYTSLENLFLMRGCGREETGVFTFSDASAAANKATLLLANTESQNFGGREFNIAYKKFFLARRVDLKRTGIGWLRVGKGNENFEVGDDSFFEDKRRLLEWQMELRQFRRTVDEVIGRLHKFTEQIFVREIREYSLKYFGYDSARQLLLSRGCVAHGDVFTYEVLNVFRERAYVLAKKLERFTKAEFYLHWGKTVPSLSRITSVSRPLTQLLKTVPGVKCICPEAEKFIFCQPRLKKRVAGIDYVEERDLDRTYQINNERNYNDLERDFMIQVRVEEPGKRGNNPESGRCLQKIVDRSTVIQRAKSQPTRRQPEGTLPKPQGPANFPSKEAPSPSSQRTIQKKSPRRAPGGVHPRPQATKGDFQVSEAVGRLLDAAGSSQIPSTPHPLQPGFQPLPQQMPDFNQQMIQQRNRGYSVPEGDPRLPAQASSSLIPPIPHPHQIPNGSFTFGGNITPGPGFQSIPQQIPPVIVRQMIQQQSGGYAVSEGVPWLPAHASSSLIPPFPPIPHLQQIPNVAAGFGGPKKSDIPSLLHIQLRRPHGEPIDAEGPSPPKRARKDARKKTPRRVPDSGEVQSGNVPAEEEIKEEPVEGESTAMKTKKKKKKAKKRPINIKIDCDEEEERQNASGKKKRASTEPAAGDTQGGSEPLIQPKLETEEVLNGIEGEQGTSVPSGDIQGVSKPKKQGLTKSMRRRIRKNKQNRCQELQSEQVQEGDAREGSIQKDEEVDAPQESSEVVDPAPVVQTNRESEGVTDAAEVAASPESQPNSTVSSVLDQPHLSQSFNQIDVDSSMERADSTGTGKEADAVVTKTRASDNPEETLSKPLIQSNGVDGRERNPQPTERREASSEASTVAERDEVRPESLVQSKPADEDVSNDGEAISQGMETENTSGETHHAPAVESQEQMQEGRVPDGAILKPEEDLGAVNESSVRKQKTKIVIVIDSEEEGEISDVTRKEEADPVVTERPASDNPEEATSEPLIQPNGVDGGERNTQSVEQSPVERTEEVRPDPGIQRAEPVRKAPGFEEAMLKLRAKKKIETIVLDSDEEGEVTNSTETKEDLVSTQASAVDSQGVVRSAPAIQPEREAIDYGGGAVSMENENTAGNTRPVSGILSAELTQEGHVSEEEPPKPKLESRVWNKRSAKKKTVIVIDLDEEGEETNSTGGEAREDSAETSTSFLQGEIRSEPLIQPTPGAGDSSGGDAISMENGSTTGEICPALGIQSADQSLVQRETTEDVPSGGEVASKEKKTDQGADQKEEEVKEENPAVVESQSPSTPTVSSGPDPHQQSNPQTSIQRMLQGQWAQEQMSLAAAEMQQLVQQATAGPSGSVESSGTNNASPQLIQPTISELMFRFHNELWNTLVIGAMEKGMNPTELGKKLLDLLEKNPTS